MSRRFGVSKRSSAHHFKNNVQRTKAANLPRTIMRGGWRL